MECGGHALIRLYEGGNWFLGCVYCPYRIPEGGPAVPAAETVNLPETDTDPEELEAAA